MPFAPRSSRRIALVLSLATLAIVLSVAARRAHASPDKPVVDGRIIAIGAAIAVDATLLVWDGLDVAGVTHPGKTYGWIESSIAAPQLALGIVLLASEEEERAAGIWTVAVSGVMLIHGVHEILRPEAPRDRGMTLAPVLGAGSSVLTIAGTF